MLRTVFPKRFIRAMTTSSSSRSAAGPAKLPIHKLPLAQQTLQAALAPLPLDSEPSAQRRNTTFPTASRGVWARTLPLWTEWPLRITKEEAIALGAVEGQGISAEDVLRRWDPVEVEGEGEGETLPNGLQVASSAHRGKLEPILLGVAEDARKALLPHLSVGQDLDAPGDAAALADILSGRKVMSNDKYVPWSTRYCGHQFGVWAGQLGDGRAISLLETESEAGRCEIQVKGAGRTPFSRTADGLAVLRSGVREYLGCEAIAALGIPSTRSLAILTSPVVVFREQGPEPSSLVARLAPSFIRIGHFEAMNPGDAGKNTRTLFLGGNWQDAGNDPVDPNDPLAGQGNLEGLRDLTMWVKNNIMGMPDKSVKEWFLEVVKRNAETTALWQVYGFMHGVLNTDNISVLGLTIDYGPYAFMDVWDQNHICNHSDPGGLYNYKNQPSRVLFALDSLASSLLPILGYEAKNGAAPAEGWGAAASTDDVRAWDAAGLEHINGWNDVFTATQQKVEREAWSKRFGLQTYQSTDDRDIVRDHLSLLTAHSGDFGMSLRQLSFFAADRVEDKAYMTSFAQRWVEAATDLPADGVSRAREEITAWLKTYAARLAAEDSSSTTRKQGMTRANPRFVLRQWVLEDTIGRMEAAIKEGDVPTAREVLARVLDMATNPFESYGEDADGNVAADACADPEGAERARLCGLGPKAMLGFQCSCSS